MNDINSLLNIDARYLENFHLQANAVSDIQMDRIVGTNCRRLRLVEERMMTDYEPVADQRSVESVIKKVKECQAKQTLLSVSWSINELRMLSYYIMYFEDDEELFQAAIDVIDQNWRDLFLNGLVFYVLNSWNQIKESYRNLVCQLVTQKLKAYRGKNKKYLLLKNHANYFEDKGPSRMAKLITMREMDVLAAPMLLGFKPSTLSMSFYSDVIVKYVEDKSEVSIDEVEDLLATHNLDRTKKLVLAELVQRAEGTNDAILQTQISKLGQSLLGDITIAATWAPFPGASEEQIKKLRLAKDLINKWFVRKVIDVFFEICVQDRNRKQYWLKYADYISHFKIAGSSFIRYRLQHDSRVENLFNKLYIETNSSSSRTAALIMYIKDRVFVEFSDVGSLYVYKHNNATIDFLNNNPKNIRSVNDLKNTSCGNLLGDGWSYFYRDEGSLRHIGYWQYRLDRWMEYKIIKEQITVDEKDDDVFAPVEKPTQSTKLDFKKTALEKPNESTITQQAYFWRTVEEDISSKEIFIRRCRIIANRNGFYIAEKTGSDANPLRYLHLCPLVQFSADTVYGNIWIKSPDQEDWRAIIHSFDGKEVLIGNIKEDSEGYSFKSSRSPAIIHFNI